MLYAIAPDLIAGLNYAFHPAELDYLIPAMATLPVVGAGLAREGPRIRKHC